MIDNTLTGGENNNKVIENFMVAYDLLQEFCGRYRIETKEPRITMLDDGGIDVFIELYYKGERVDCTGGKVGKDETVSETAIDLILDAVRTVYYIHGHDGL